MPELFAPSEFNVPKDSVPVMRMGGYAGQWVEWAGYAMAFEVVQKVSRPVETAPFPACRRTIVSARIGATC
jgi:hypothetical protein